MNQKTKPRLNGMQWLAIILILAGLAAALSVDFNRIQLEQANRTTGIMVDYDELSRCAQGRGMTFEEAVRKVHNSGATGIIVRERTLDDLEKTGKIVILQGAELKVNLQGGQFGQEAAGLVIDDSASYILTDETTVYDQILKLLEAKKRHPQTMVIGPYQAIRAELYSGELSLLGVGYPLEELKAAADQGMGVVPRIRNWAPVNEPSIQAEADAVARIPGLAGFGFNDETLPGGDNPNALAYFAQYFDSLKVPLVSFEFYDQTGLNTLAGLMDDQVLRAHSIADNEIKKYNVASAVDRFRLAAAERNIRIIYVRFFGMDQPVAALDTNLELIKQVKSGLSAEGMILGLPGAATPVTTSMALRFCIGLGVLAAGAWVLAITAEPLVKGRWQMSFLVVMILIAVAWGGVLRIWPVLSVKLMALAAAIIFPSLGTLLILKKDMVKSRRTESLPHAVKDLLLMSLISLCGALMMCALLTETRFMLKLDSFAGVKLAHIIPLLLVPLALWLRERKAGRFLLKTAEAPVKAWQLIAGAFILAALAVYILRTGNTGVSGVSSLELKFRQLLDTFLGVRPRTKEFAIGHPLMLVLLYFGYRFQMYPVLLMGLIGQVSLTNTYAHLHTPLLVSLFRSFNGLWLGLLAGSAAVFVLSRILRIALKQPKGSGHR